MNLKIQVIVLFWITLTLPAQAQTKQKRFEISLDALSMGYTQTL